MDRASPNQGKRGEKRGKEGKRGEKRGKEGGREEGKRENEEKKTNKIKNLRPLPFDGRRKGGTQEQGKTRSAMPTNLLKTRLRGREKQAVGSNKNKKARTETVERGSSSSQKEDERNKEKESERNTNGERKEEKQDDVFFPFAVVQKELSRFETMMGVRTTDVHRAMTDILSSETRKTTNPATPSSCPQREVEVDVCSSCKTTLEVDSARGDMVCSSCGIVKHRCYLPCFEEEVSSSVVRNTEECISRSELEHWNVYFRLSEAEMDEATRRVLSLSSFSFETKVAAALLLPRVTRLSRPVHASRKTPPLPTPSVSTQSSLPPPKQTLLTRFVSPSEGRRPPPLDKREREGGEEDKGRKKTAEDGKDRRSSQDETIRQGEEPPPLLLPIALLEPSFPLYPLGSGRPPPPSRRRLSLPFLPTRPSSHSLSDPPRGGGILSGWRREREHPHSSVGRSLLGGGKGRPRPC